MARDRPDLLFPVKELSGFMSRPTHGALQKLKKLIGYLKGTADYCVVLEPPVPGQGKWRSTEKFWVLESFTDADWSSNQKHRRSTSCGIHLVCGAFAYGSSRTQKVVSLSSCESELPCYGEHIVRWHLLAPMLGVHHRGNHRTLSFYR